MVDQTPEGGWLLLTNDDGIEAPGFRMLAQALNKAGHSIIAFAPSENNSAAGMRINLMKPMKLRPRHDLFQPGVLTNQKQKFVYSNLMARHVIR